jgi:hypothetical protein
MSPASTAARSDAAAADSMSPVPAVKRELGLDLGGEPAAAPQAATPAATPKSGDVKSTRPDQGLFL